MVDLDPDCFQAVVMVFVEVCFAQRLTLTLAFHAVVMVFVEVCFAQMLTLTLTVFRL